MKWLWRYLAEKGRLWATTVRSIYGEIVWDEEGMILDGTRRYRGGWWHKIVSLGRGQSGMWFINNISRRVGRGNDIKFWVHKWVGPKPLKFVFPRLYELSDNKEAVISELGSWVEGVWTWDLKWKRVLFDREVNAANDLYSFISSVAPIAGCDDGWSWRASKEELYTKKSAYSIIKGVGNVNPVERSNQRRLAKIWKIKAPQKTKATAWRLLRNRLPTCENLRKRNIHLGEEEILCNACYFHLESTDHLFLSCPKTEKVWCGIFGWLGMCVVQPQSIEAHFDMFINLGKGKKSRQFLATLWICIIWLLWRKRNESRFEQKTWEINDLIDEVKVRMRSWNTIFEIVDKEISSQSWFSGVIHSAVV